MTRGRGHFVRRPRDLACREQVERCQFCDLDPWDEDVYGCVPFDVRGLPRIPLDWGDDWPPGERPGDDNPCGCGAQVGYLHHSSGCTLEICPWADEHPDDGEQLLFCGCLVEDES